MDAFTIEDLLKFVPAMAPVIMEMLKKVQENVIPQIQLPWPMNIVVKAGANALIAAIISYFAGLDPVGGVAVGASASLAYAAARPKAPKA